MLRAIKLALVASLDIATDAVRDFFLRDEKTRSIQHPPIQLTLEGLEERWCPAQITWTNGDGNGLWSDAKNWSAGSVPGSGDDVFFDGAVSNTNATVDQNYLGTQVNQITFKDNYSGTLTLSHSLQVNAYTQNSGDLAGVGQLTVAQNGNFNWGSGTIANTQFNLSAGVNGSMGSDVGISLDGTELSNAGSLTWEGGSLATSNGGEVNNINNAKFTVNSTNGEAILFSDGTGNVNLNVSSGATMTVVPGAGNDVQISGAFKDAGTLTITNGSLQLNANSEFSGQVNLASGTTLSLSPTLGSPSATALFDDGSKVTSPGSTGFVEAAMGTVQINDNPNGPTAGVQIDRLQLDSGATILGTGSLSVNTAFTMNGGSLQVGTFTIKPNVTATIDTTGAWDSPSLGGNFVNNGTLNWTGSISILAGTTITNNSALYFKSANLQDGSQGGTPGTLTNYGTLGLLGAMGQMPSVTTIGIPTSNSGTLNVGAPGFSFASTLTQNAGTINLTNATTFSVGGVFTINGGNFTAISGETVTATGGIVQNGGTVSLANSPGTLTIAGAYTLNGGTIALQANGGGNNSDQLNVTGAFTATRGNINISWINNTPPNQQTTYTLLKYSSISGFQKLNVTDPDNTTFTPNSNGTEADLTYTPPS